MKVQQDKYHRVTDFWLRPKSFKPLFSHTWSHQRSACEGLRWSFWPTVSFISDHLFPFSLLFWPLTLVATLRSQAVHTLSARCSILSRPSQAKWVRIYEYSTKTFLQFLSFPHSFKMPLDSWGVLNESKWAPQPASLQSGSKLLHHHHSTRYPTVFSPLLEFCIFLFTTAKHVLLLSEVKNSCSCIQWRNKAKNNNK